MPLTIPTLDDRRYQDLLDEALARIPVHNPEWTNFNQSDPGVTLIEVFAFLTESLLYRANQIPERNRRKFLSLLGLGLRPAASAQGLVAFTNDRGPQETITLNAGLEVRGGQVPFRTDNGLDVLPVEALVYCKRALANPSAQLKSYYAQLYASYQGQQTLPPNLQFYESTPLVSPSGTGVDLGADTVDGSLWIALLLRTNDPPDSLDVTRQSLAGKTLSLGIVPMLAGTTLRLAPGNTANPQGEPLLQYYMPQVPADGRLPDPPNARLPRYRLLDASASQDILAQPGVVQITLPSDPAAFQLWSNLEPLEAGVGDFPPALDDTKLDARVITWLRIRSTAAVHARLLWAGINVAGVTQRARVANESLANGTGEPDQTVTLSQTPVIPGSVRLSVAINGRTELWGEISDLTAAGPEVPVPDPRLPPGEPQPANPLISVFTLDPESGRLTFGDGARGRRPPFGAVLRADYDFGQGAAGNVRAGAIDNGPALPAGMKVANPVRTWGGAAAESVTDGEKQIAGYLQHRDRLVTATDFATITRRTPGVDIGRVEVVPAYNPELGPNEPGDAPGAVTLLLIPKYDPLQPDAPLPDRLFLDTVRSYVEPRRLITTEVFLCPPAYVPVWVSAGIQVVAGASIAQVREAVRQALTQFLSALPPPAGSLASAGGDGWPLRKPVVALELQAVANRVPGVLLVNGVLIAQGTQGQADQIPMQGLQLPRLAGLAVDIGSPAGLDQLRGQVSSQGATGGGAAALLPVPVIPEVCR